MVNNLFNVHQVLEEIKSSTGSKTSCLACKFIINMVRFMIKTSRSDTEILSFVGTHCSTLKIQTPRVCTGVMNLIGVSFKIEICKKINVHIN
jgi:sphingomyelin phosphodiesterase